MTTTNDPASEFEGPARPDDRPEVTVLPDAETGRPDGDGMRAEAARGEPDDTTPRPGDRLLGPPDDGSSRSADPLGLSGDGDDDVLLGNGAELFSRWEQIQGRFVDDPRHAVEEADALVGHVVDDLSRAFANQRERLEHRWKAGEDVSTEELRHSLQRYRAFFQRLVAV